VAIAVLGTGTLEAPGLQPLLDLTVRSLRVSALDALALERLTGGIHLEGLQEAHSDGIFAHI